MKNLSATAHLVAMYRALESDRPNALFQDLFARRLAGGEGALMVEVLGNKQQETSAMAIRTCVIDEMITHLVRSNRVNTVLNLAAGLDTRPYRLDLPASLRWIEVDLPDILKHKEQNLKNEQPVCSIERVKLDLIDVGLRKALFTQINASANQVLVITEGLLSYLTEGQVASLAADLRQQSNFHWWLFELASPMVLKQAQKSDRQQRFDQYFANGKATFLFAPDAGAEFFRPYGWKLTQFRSIWQEACRLKRQTDLVRFAGFPIRCFAKQYWQAITERSGFVLLERDFCTSID
ncbi:MAG TPA: SAM-dependent methyltransferase [Leptolyngbya sp.]|jgi:methyltransferase (TIGR00027 family)|nr:SAM-dependent methyltransferase [Leptolyngbya sp.]